MAKSGASSMTHHKISPRVSPVIVHAEITGCAVPDPWEPMLLRGHLVHGMEAGAPRINRVLFRLVGCLSSSLHRQK